MTTKSERLPLVYIAGPYTNPDPVENTRNAIKAGMRLYDSGWGVPLIPHLSLLAHIVDPREVDYWYELDLAQLDHCSAVWRIPGASTGADKEVAHAEAAGIPVFTSWATLRPWLVQQ